MLIIGGHRDLLSPLITHCPFGRANFGWGLLNHIRNVLIFIEKLNAVFTIIPPLVPHNYRD